MCSVLGITRAWQSHANKNRSKLLSSDYSDNVKIHIAGCIGETAVAKLLGIYNPQTFNVFKSQSDLSIGDVSIEVRSRSNHNHDMIVRLDDDNNSIYILSTGDGNLVRIHGWMRGSAAKKDKYKKNYGGHGEAFFVPSQNLNKMPELLNMVANKTLTGG
jgi:hypothetical protein